MNEPLSSFLTPTDKLNVCYAKRNDLVREEKLKKLKVWEIPSLKDFYYIKNIGQGGFSNVMMGKFLFHTHFDSPQKHNWRVVRYENNQQEENCFRWQSKLNHQRKKDPEHDEAPFHRAAPLGIYFSKINMLICLRKTIFCWFSIYALVASSFITFKNMGDFQRQMHAFISQRLC